MYFSTIVGAAASLALVSAVPLSKRYDSYNIHFNGAAGASYTVSVTFDGNSHPTNNVLSISSVSVDPGVTVDISTQCVLTTVDQPPVLVAQGDGVWTVGPPETVTAITCTESNSTPPTPPSYITIEFDGADPTDGAYYTMNVPLDGAQHDTNNVLSISALVETFGSLDLSVNCDFIGVDSNTALAAAPVLAPAGALRWQVGPPQTILSVACSAS